MCEIISNIYYRNDKDRILKSIHERCKKIASTIISVGKEIHSSIIILTEFLFYNLALLMQSQRSQSSFSLKAETRFSMRATNVNRDDFREKSLAYKDRRDAF